MESQNAVTVAVAIDQLLLQSRLRDIALLAQSDRSDRVGTIATVISQLPPGGYLIGCGPYCCGVYPLTVEEVILGRPPSPLEALPDQVPDFTLNDAVLLAPREVSRIHAKIVRRRTDSSLEFLVRDANSRNGTYINGRRVGHNVDSSDPAEQAPLRHGDVLSLGPSGVNSYVFVRTD